MLVMMSIKPPIRQILSLISGEFKSIYQHKLECKQLTSKLFLSEKRYSTMISQGLSDQMFKHQMVTLKQTIEKDRLQLAHVERKVSNSELEINNHLSELQRLDQSESRGDR